MSLEGEPEEPLQKSTPDPDRVRKPVRVDVDWAAVIANSLKGERAHLVEAVGQAIGTYGDELLGDVERMIAEAADQLRTEVVSQSDELRAEVERLRTEVAAQAEYVHTLAAMADQLRANLDQFRERKARTRKAKPSASLSNGNGHAASSERAG